MIPKMEVVIIGSTCGLREDSFTDRRMDMMFMGKKQMPLQNNVPHSTI